MLEMPVDWKVSFCCDHPTRLECVFVREYCKARKEKEVNKKTIIRMRSRFERKSSDVALPTDEKLFSHLPVGVT